MSEEKNIQKVVSGSVKTKKPSSTKKVANAIFAEDMSQVKEHIVWDYVIPYFSDFLRNLGISTIEAIFGRSGSRSNTPGSHYNYNKVSIRNDPRGNNQNGYNRNYNRGGYSVNDIVLDNRGDADMVLDSLYSIIKEYSIATIGDLYELVGISPQFTDQKWGWTDISGARVESAYGGGWLIRLPNPKPVSN